MMRKLWTSVLGVVAVAAHRWSASTCCPTASCSNARLDLTQQHLYTLSPGTRRILAGLKEPITLQLFYSRQLGAAAPAYGAYADRVREMLREYAADAHGKLQLEFYDPEPFSDTEDRALAYGLQGVPLEPVRRAGVFRPRRHQPARRPAHHPVLPVRSARASWNTT